MSSAMYFAVDSHLSTDYLTSVEQWNEKIGFKARFSLSAMMYNFDLIVVEELGQLSMEMFERLLSLWLQADSIPALVFLGDFAQLPGVESTRAVDI